MKTADDETFIRIRQLVSAYPHGLNITEISRKVKKTRNIVAKHLGILCASGQVEVRKVGTAKLYLPARRVPISGMLDFSSDYILVLDEQMRIVQMNAPLMELLGDSENDLIGLSIEKADHPFLGSIPIKALCENSGKPIEISETIGKRKRHFSVKQMPVVFDDGGRGRSLVIEDITKRREAEEETRILSEQRDFFARKLTEFAELPPGADIFHAIGEGLDKVLPGAIIDVNEFDPGTNTLQFRAIFGQRGEEWYNVLNENGCCWEASPAYESVQEVLSEGKLYRLPGGMYYASFHQIPEEKCEWIEKEFNLGEFYSIGLTWRGTLLGNILFVLRKGVTISNPATVELYGRAASIALQRHIAERKIADHAGSKFRDLSGNLAG